MILPDTYWSFAWFLSVYLIICIMICFAKAGSEFAATKSDDFMGSVYILFGWISMALLMMWAWINWVLFL